VRILLDECCEAALGDALRADGHDVDHIAATMSGADDTAVLQQAVAQQRILLTNDRGFGRLSLSDEAAMAVAVVVLRIPEWEAAKRLKALREILSHEPSELFGNLIVLDEDKARLRRLRRK